MEEITAEPFPESNPTLEEINNEQVEDTQSTTVDNNSPMFDDSQIIEQEKLLAELAQQSLKVVVPFHQESLDKILIDSLFDSMNPRPLALYIHDDESILTDLFNKDIISSEIIYSYLVNQFVVWNWNLTQANYYELLSDISAYVGEEVAAVINSIPLDIYPLLICLIFDHGQIQVESVINSTMSVDEVFTQLIQTCDAFNNRFELPDTTGLRLTNIATENWSIPPSTLTEVNNTSDEFKRVANDFDGGKSSIVRIDRIENTVWLIEYFKQKQLIDSRVGHEDNEKLLFHGCPYDAAEQILQKGFDHDRIGRNGTYFGHGFYFSTRRELSNQYAIPNPTTREKRIIMCRVLVGRSCRGNSSMTQCPQRYESTTNEKNIHVVYSNRHILPEYLITYK